jgi:transposase
MDRPKRRFFPEEFKREAVAQVETSGRSVAVVAAELGLCDTVLRKWVRQRGSGNRPALPLPRPGMQATPAAALPLSPADQAAEIARLKRELERTRMERDILKKAVVIFGRDPR